MAPRFRRFLGERQSPCELVLAGATIGSISAACAVDAMCAFFEELPLERTPRPTDLDDALLLQISPGRPAGAPVVNITRQAYRGAGRSVQLGLDLDFAGADVDPSRGAHFTLWSWDAPSIDGFRSIAFGELADRGALFLACAGRVHVDRF
ncbi:MAG: hypothetical protein Q8O67_34005 [Deltaproteobacteria bacterium]|nr:hypothetical protein [Deltaproteobacteria bacterium]